MANPEKAQGIVRTHVAWSVGAGMIPLPILDLVAVTAIQLDMLRELAATYDKDFSETSGKSWISALGGTYVARLGSQALKTIPGIGTVIGGVSLAITSGATTFAIGQVFIRHFDSGGDFFDFDADQFKDYFKEKFEEGKDMASKMQKEKKGKKKNPAPQKPTKEEAKEATSSRAEDYVARLRKLKDMYESGVLTDEEYSKLKAKVLEEL